MNNRRLMDVAEIASVWKERAHHTLTATLGMRKLSARWIPRLLISEQKMQRLIMSGSLRI